MSTKPMEPTAAWQLEADSAEAYERYLVPAVMARWAEALVERAALRPGGRVLDVGCGTGIVARTAAARLGQDGRLTGIDLNEGMLARARMASSGVRPAIEWRQGNAAALPFPDGAFDVVLSQQMLQFVPDRGAALREMRRMLDSRGRAAVAVCRPIERSPGYTPLAEALRRHVGPEAEAMMRSPFPPWSIHDVHRLFEGSGFREVSVIVDVGAIRYPSAEEFVRREAASSPLAGPIGALRAQVRKTLVEELEAALAPHVDDEGLVFPIETYIVIAQA